MFLKSIARNAWRIFRIGLLVFFIFTFSGVLMYRFLPVPYTYLMFQRLGEQAFSGDKIRLVHVWVPIEQISPNIIRAAVAGEDNNFTSHYGIDFIAIEKAYKYNKRGKRIRGASTITQQTCKNVFLWNGRNYIRKGMELYFTFLVETLWSKERIMEVYLNSIEMGNGIYGIEAASQIYYHKSASKLTRSEAAMIVAVFPNPRQRNPAKPTTYLKRRQQRILNLMNKIGEVTF
jgi:monofunctional biosynthetic peptidoglycan transglycosylase